MQLIHKGIKKIKPSQSIVTMVFVNPIDLFSNQVLQFLKNLVKKIP